MHPILVFLMLGHFILNKSDSLSRYVTAVVIEAVELSEQGEESVADSAAEFIVIFALFV